MYLSVGLARHDSQATTTSVVFAHALDANRERGRRARRSWASPSRDTSKSRARLSKSIKMQTQENARKAKGEEGAVLSVVVEGVGGNDLRGGGWEAQVRGAIIDPTLLLRWAPP